jgi:hypothetical protein
MGQTAAELRTDIEQRRQNLSGTVDAIEDRVLPGRIVGRRKEAARGWLHGARERVMGSSGPVQQTKERMAGAASSVESTVEGAADKVSDAPGMIAEQTRGAPLLAGGIAFGIGALVAMIIPETEPERHAAEAIAPRLSGATEAVKEAGQETMAAAKHAAQDAASELKAAATEGAEQMVERAKEAGSDVGRAASPSGPTGS